MKEDNIEEISKYLEEIFMDRLPEGKREVNGISGKNGKVWFWKESMARAGNPLSEEEVQKYSDTLLDGLYTLDPMDNTVQFMDNDKQDGYHYMQRWAREDEDGNKIGIKYLKEAWKSGSGHIIEEYETYDDFLLAVYESENKT